MKMTGSHTATGIASLDQPLTSANGNDGSALPIHYPVASESDASARQLSDLSLWQSFQAGVPLAIGDCAMMWLLVYSVSQLVGIVLEPPRAYSSTALAWLAAFMLMPIARLAGLYPALGLSPIVEFRQLVRAAGLALVTCVAIELVVAPSAPYHCLLVAAVAFIACLPILPAGRFVVRVLLAKFTTWGAPVLIFAEPGHAAELCAQLQRMPERGLRPVGILLRPESYWSVEHQQFTVPVNDVRDAVATARARKATWLIIGDSRQRESTDVHDTMMHSLSVIPSRILLSISPSAMGMWDETQTVGPACGVRLGGSCPDSFRGTVKRLFDVAVATAVLLFASPLLVLIAVAIRISSPGPVFYRQARVGRYGRPFYAWKFRSMRLHADTLLQACLDSNPDLRAEWELTRKLKHDPRITAIGRFLRKTSLDELPQLWNILVGDMSVVGPRPIVDSPTYDRNYIVEHPQEFATYKSVRPGLTGMWQVTCRNSGVYEMRIYWDMYYIRNWSLWLDVYIVLRTIRTVILREGAY